MTKPTPKFKGVVIGGALAIADKSGFQKYLNTLLGEVEITVRKYRDQRSERQNNYYWGVVVPLLAQETGYDAESMHEILKAKFLMQSYSLKGEHIRAGRSTTTLDTVEFNEYTEDIRRWAAEWGINIPQPNEVEY